MSGKLVKNPALIPIIIPVLLMTIHFRMILNCVDLRLAEIVIWLKFL